MNGARTTGQSHAKKKLSQTQALQPSKNELKKAHRPKCKTKTYNARRQHRRKSSLLLVGNDLLDTISKAQIKKEITDKLDFIKIKNFW